MSETFELDIDRERIHMDDEWLSREDLTARITEKVKSGDYRVARLSMALEQLEETLKNISAVELKVTPEVLSTYRRMAEFEERPLAMVLRRALVHYLGSEDATQRLFKMRRAEKAAEG
ncbi:MAG: hypothetical protein KC620_16825 [Myxococcales bacterium]|nr:hypothetical protein [Myxococcales bacterium]